MGNATIIIKVAGTVIVCLDCNINEIKEELNGVKTIYGMAGEEITIPAEAIEDIVPGDESDEASRYTFGDTEIYVEFY